MSPGRATADVVEWKVTPRATVDDAKAVEDFARASVAEFWKDLEELMLEARTKQNSKIVFNIFINLRCNV